MRKRLRKNAGLIVSGLLLSGSAAAQQIPYLDVDKMCAATDQCSFHPQAPACLALSDESRAYRRRSINECIEQQQTSFGAAEAGWDRLSAADRNECLQRYSYLHNYRVIGDCVTQKLTQRERNQTFDQLHAFQR